MKHWIEAVLRTLSVSGIIGKHVCFGAPTDSILTPTESLIGDCLALHFDNIRITNTGTFYER
jgi:hypothetical protein